MAKGKGPFGDTGADAAVSQLAQGERTRPEAPHRRCASPVSRTAASCDGEQVARVSARQSIVQSFLDVPRRARGHGW